MRPKCWIDCTLSLLRTHFSQVCVFVSWPVSARVSGAWRYNILMNTAPAERPPGLYRPAWPDTHTRIHTHTFDRGLSQVKEQIHQDNRPRVCAAHTSCSLKALVSINISTNDSSYERLRERRVSEVCVRSLSRSVFYNGRHTPSLETQSGGRLWNLWKIVVTFKRSLSV